MKTLAVIQARVGSSRLPAKVLLEIAPGLTMLESVIERARKVNNIDQVVVATTTEPDAVAIVAICERLGVPVSRGSEFDVLDRYVQAARPFAPDVLVRITSDCPLLDPAIVHAVIEKRAATNADYASNAIEHSYPRGLDCEVVRYSALEQAWHEATRDYERVHVMPYLYKNPDRFKIESLVYERDLSHHRWTVDTPEDLVLVQTIMMRLGSRARDAGFLEVLSVVEGDPALSSINGTIVQKSLEAC